MCKLFALTNMANVKVTTKLIEATRDAVCKLGDRDGYGYSVNTASGNLWGERTLTPFDFEPLTPGVSNVTRSCPIAEVNSNSFGVLSQDDNVSFVAHGRMSTNDVTLSNTHPFVSDQVALSHNGVVSDPYCMVSDERLTTTCDTEILLRLWEQDGIEGIEENAAGYYAIAMLDTLGQLHIVRDDRVSLVISYSKTIDSFILATNESIIQDVARAMGWEIEKSESVRANTYAIFQGNVVVEQQEIIPLGYVKGLDSFKASKALGVETFEDYPKPVGVSYNELTKDDYTRWDGKEDYSDEYQYSNDDDCPITVSDMMDLEIKRRAG